MPFWNSTSYRLLNRSDFSPIWWPWYRARPSPNCECFPWSICNVIGMSAGNTYPSEHLVPSRFGTCLCSNYRDQISRTCRVFPDFSHVREKCGKLCIFYILSSKRGIIPFKSLRKVTTLKFDTQYIKTKKYEKFQPNMSKHVGEKCGKLHISYIQVHKEA